MRVALLDAIAGVATGSRIVADVSDGSAELYRSGGFVRASNGAAVRTLEEQAAAPASIRAATLEETRSRDPRRVGTGHL